MFTAIKWSSLGDPKGGKTVDVQPAFDIGEAFENASLDVLDSDIFKQY